MEILHVYTNKHVYIYVYVYIYLCIQVGTGLSDEDLKTATVFFKEHLAEGPRAYYRLGSSQKPDVWFEPAQVYIYMYIYGISRICKYGDMRYVCIHVSL